MAVGTAPPRIAEPTQVMLQELAQLADGERVEPCRGQLDRQRHAVEEADDSVDLVEPGILGDHVATHCPSPIQEQLGRRARRLRLPTA